MTPAMPKQIGDYNRNQMLTILRERGPTSRVELSRLLDLSPPAVTRNIAKMMTKGIIRECGAEESNMGRKPTLIELCDEYCYVLCADIVGDTLKTAIADLNGMIVKYSEKPLLKEKGASAVLEQLIDSLQNMIADAKAPKKKIWAAIVGTPGIFDAEKGRSSFTFFLEGWDDIDIRAKVAEAIGIETIIKNDIDLDVIGESWKGVGKEYESILYVKLGQGFAARIVLKDKLLHGLHQMAGEIGYMLPAVPSAAASNAANYEDMLCNGAVAKRYAGLHGDGKANTIAELCTLADNGDSFAEEVLCDLLDRFAIALLNSIAVLDPHVIILGGDASCFGERDIDILKRRIEKFFPLSQNIITSTLKNQACLHGAIKTGLDCVEMRINELW